VPGFFPHHHQADVGCKHTSPSALLWPTVDFCCVFADRLQTTPDSLTKPSQFINTSVGRIFTASPHFHSDSLIIAEKLFQERRYQIAEFVSV
jgi:hypothetical protein